MKWMFAIVFAMVVLPQVLPGKVRSSKHPYSLLKSLLGHTSQSGEGHHGIPIPDLEELQEDLRAALTAHGRDSRAAGLPSAQFLLSVFQKLQLGLRLPQADTVRTFSAHAPKTPSRRHISVSFNLSAISPQETTQLAELRLRPMRHLVTDQTATKKLRVALLFADGTTEKKGAYPVQARRDPEDGYLVFDLTRAVRRVLAHEKTRKATVQFTIKSRRSAREPRSLNDLSVTENDAVLVVYSEDKEFFKQFNLPSPSHRDSEDPSQKVEEDSDNIETASRQKRSKGSQKSKGKRGKCRVQEFQVDFDTIGWGQWIVYPKRFNAGLCAGRCPLPVDAKFTPTNHAMLQSLMRLARKDSAPRPCCVPTKLLPMSMLYYEEDEVVIRHHEDMVVDACGCR